jgi:hypothetical protein
LKFGVLLGLKQDIGRYGSNELFHEVLFLFGSCLGQLGVPPLELYLLLDLRGILSHQLEDEAPLVLDLNNLEDVSELLARDP